MKERQVNITAFRKGHEQVTDAPPRSQSMATFIHNSKEESSVGAARQPMEPLPPPQADEGRHLFVRV